MPPVAARLLLVALTAGLWGCPSTPPSLVNEVKRVLAERDRKLTSYHVVVDSAQGTEKAKHEFFYRAPNRSRGTITEGPEPQTLSYDGLKFYKITPGEKKFEAFDVKLSPENAAYFLASTFTPFVPEGFRTPLLPSKGVTARKVAHPKAPDALEVTVTVEGATVVWVLRWPSGDVLLKRVGSIELSVDEEHCDQALGLCVPKLVTQRESGVVQATTSLTTIELNVAIPNDFFTLKAPEGFHGETHELVETKQDSPQ